MAEVEDDHRAKQNVIAKEVPVVKLVGKVRELGASFGDSLPYRISVNGKETELMGAGSEFWDKMKQLEESNSTVELTGYETTYRTRYTREIRKAFKVTGIKDLGQQEDKTEIVDKKGKKPPAKENPVIFKKFRLSDFVAAKEATVHVSEGKLQDAVTTAKELGFKLSYVSKQSPVFMIEIPSGVTAAKLRALAKDDNVASIQPTTFASPE